MYEDLITWLRAELDEDEGRAPLAAEVMALRPSTAPFGARLLAEVEAKRRIVEACDGALLGEGAWDPQLHGGSGDEFDLARAVLRFLALPYADRPGYRDEWRP